MATYNPVHFRSHVERCLQDVWEECCGCIEPDGDGDYCFDVGTAACFVRIDNSSQVVRVIGLAAHGVRRSLALLNEINDVNTRTGTAHVFFVDGLVIVAQAMVADACSSESLSQAFDSVAKVANDIGDMIARVHGGSVPRACVLEPTDSTR